jgi:predicted nucleic acid-binding protein
MAESCLLDANILLRYLTNDDPRKAAACEHLFRRAAKGDTRLVVSDLCLAEVAWTLDSFYGLDAPQIASQITAILNTPGIKCSDLALWLDALNRYAHHNVDFIGAYHAALSATTKHKLYSYDRDFDAFADVTRLEP